MMTVTHITAGVALGSLVGEVPGQAAIAFAVGWASHYVLDSLPHWEVLYKPFSVGNFSTQQPTSKWPKGIIFQATLDVLVAFFLLYLYLQHADPYTPILRSALFWGGIGGILPDILDNVPFWNSYLHRFSFFKKLVTFHENIHVDHDKTKHLPKLTGLITQVIVIGAGLWVLW